MPSEKEIEIILRLRDEVTKTLTGVQSNIHKFSNAVKSLGLDMRKTGRQMSSIGSTMAMAGAAITAPLVAAYKEAGKFNAEIGHQLNQTANVFRRLSISIGEALLPVMRQLTDAVARSVGWWESLDKATRDKIVQNIFKLGKSLVILGAAFVVVGKSISFLANLAFLSSTLLSMNPVVLAIAVGFVALAIAMWKSKEAAVALLNTMQFLAPLVPALQMLRLSMGKTSEEFFGKPGDWAKIFDNFKEEVRTYMSMWKDLRGELFGRDADKNTAPPGNFFSGLKKGLQESLDALEKWADTGLQTAQKLFSGMQQFFQTLFYDAFTGQLKTAKDYFVAWGQQILKIFSDVLSDMVTYWIESQLWKIFGDKSEKSVIPGVDLGIIKVIGGGGKTGGSGAGGAFAAGGWIREPIVGLGLSSGKSYTFGEKGPEYVSPNGQAGGETHIHYHSTVVVKAWDFADVYGHKAEIQGIINESLRRQGSVAKSVNKYT